MIVWKKQQLSLLYMGLNTDRIRRIHIVHIKGKVALLNIDNLSMIRETNIVYSKDFEHPEVIQGVVQRYNEM